MATPEDIHHNLTKEEESLSDDELLADPDDDCDPSDGLIIDATPAGSFTDEEIQAILDA